MRRNIRGGVKLKHLNKSGHWPSGNVRYYYRPHGQKGIAMPDVHMSDPKFLVAYVAASEGKAPVPSETHRTGTLGAGIRAYEASDLFLALAPSTRASWRRMLTDIRRRYGAVKLGDLRAKHIRIDLARLDPHPANNRRKVWRAMGRFWQERGLVDDDPAVTVRARLTPKTDGHEPWTREDVADFRKYWPHDSAQRLAMELMHRTCASIGDACQLGPGMVKDGWLYYKRQKSKSQATCPMIGGPDWFEPSDHLEKCLSASPRHMTYIITAYGAPRSSKAAAQWFSRACKEAKVEKTAHGLRKHRASVFKENGASTEQRMAILGHETEGEAQRYSKSADLQKVITGTEMSNSPKPVGQKQA